MNESTSSISNEELLRQIQNLQQKVSDAESNGKKQLIAASIGVAAVGLMVTGKDLEDSKSDVKAFAGSCLKFIGEGLFIGFVASLLI